MLTRLILARFGLVPPPLTAVALEVQTRLRLLEAHLETKGDRRGAVMCRDLHKIADRVLRALPPGAVEVGALSATPKPPEAP